MDWRARTECNWTQAFKGTLVRNRFGSAAGGAPEYICKFCGRWLKSHSGSMEVKDLRCVHEGCRALQQIDEPGEAYPAEMVGTLTGK